jgi:hypothetical protein
MENPLHPVDALISGWFGSSVILLTIGFPAFKERLLRFISRHWAHELQTTDPEALLNVALSNYLNNNLAVPYLPNSSTSILSANLKELTKSDEYFDMFGPHYVIDIRTSFPDRVVPMHVFRPYVSEKGPSRRYELEISKTDMSPHFFVNSKTGLAGVPIVEGFKILDQSRPFRDSRTSLKVKINACFSVHVYIICI